jgi:Domain of unknown function (DUF1906)
MIYGYDSEEAPNYNYAAKLAALTPPVKFACRYVSHNAKGILLPEVKALHAAGIKIVPIYEGQGNEISTFNAPQGKVDIDTYFELAEALGIPANIPPFLTADLDSNPEQNAGPIASYMQAALNELRVRLNNKTLKLGFYGNGLACAYMKSVNLAGWTWLAGGHGMQGSQEYYASNMWDIAQDVGDKRFGGKTGLDIDSDEAQDATLPFAW